jgi:hypothetical protein
VIGLARERGNAPALPAPNDFLQLETKNVLWALSQLGPRESFKAPNTEVEAKIQNPDHFLPPDEQQSLCDS